MTAEDKQKLFEYCHELAKAVHAHQTRRDGCTPYIVHPEALAEMFDDPIDKCIAILHDTVEDSDWFTLKVLRDKLVEFDPEAMFKSEFIRIKQGVYYLTHDKERYSYMQYVAKLSHTKFAKFKFADITINLCDKPTDKQKDKYKKAMKILLERPQYGYDLLLDD